VPNEQIELGVRGQRKVVAGRGKGEWGKANSPLLVAQRAGSKSSKKKRQGNIKENGKQCSQFVMRLSKNVWATLERTPKRELGGPRKPRPKGKS